MRRESRERVSPPVAPRRSAVFVKARQNGVTQQRSYLGDDCVSEGLESKLVQPSSKPIIHSANSLKLAFPRRFPAFEAKTMGIPGEARKNWEGGAVMFPASFTVGVGNNPYTVALVGSANGSSRYAMPFRIIPERGQGPENVCKPSTKQHCAVFQDDSDGCQFANQAGDFREKPAPLIRQSFCVWSGNTDALAGETAADDIDGNSIGSKSFCGKLADICVAGDAWPVLGEDFARERFDFAEGDGFKAIVFGPFKFGALQSERKAADAAEQVKDAQLAIGGVETRAMANSVRVAAGFGCGVDHLDRLPNRSARQETDGFSVFSVRGVGADFAEASGPMRKPIPATVGRVQKPKDSRAAKLAHFCDNIKPPRHSGVVRLLATPHTQRQIARLPIVAHSAPPFAARTSRDAVKW